jgi:hypothetical protein
VAAAERLIPLGLLTLVLVLLSGVSEFGGRALAGPPRGRASSSAIDSDAEPKLEPKLEPPTTERMRSVWRPASVVWPLAPLAVTSTEAQPIAARLAVRQAMLAGREPVSSVRGAVDLDRTHAVGVWIAALESASSTGPPHRPSSAASTATSR